MTNFLLFTVYALTFLLVLMALASWMVLILKKFKSAMILPCRTEGCEQLSKKLFILQSFLLLFAAGLVWMRISQLNQQHTDNVIDNLIYGLSSLFLIRAIGDFKNFGFFSSENNGDFTRLDRRFFTPLALLLFALSLSLVI
ncbi:MAG: DUF3995 domain-containing protein [Bacteroidales bacterium]|nr:DUF3995 domain-containing protein [Bacteroidales bacterium]